ncbi:MAG: hypothetical protein ACI9TA_002484 [Reinekea sp.]|jgi:hypothetical protein
MKTFLLSTTAALAIVASAGHAQSVEDQVIPQLQAQGYFRFEVTNSPNQVKIEAIADGIKFEAIYDAATGELLKDEVEPVDDDDTTPGVSVRTKAADFLRNGNDSNDDDDDDDDDVDDDDDDVEDNNAEDYDDDDDDVDDDDDDDDD